MARKGRTKEQNARQNRANAETIAAGGSIVDTGALREALERSLAKPGHTEKKKVRIRKRLDELGPMIGTH